MSMFYQEKRQGHKREIDKSFHDEARGKKQNDTTLWEGRVRVESAVARGTPA